jgi:hypothetical protein
VNLDVEEAMPQDALPIACSLSAGELLERVTQMAAIGRDALIDTRIEGTRARLRFAAEPDVRERIDAVVAAESHCCAFLTMRVTDEPGAVVLTIDAPGGTELVLSEMVGAFAGPPTSRGGPRRPRAERRRDWARR